MAGSNNKTTGVFGTALQTSVNVGVVNTGVTAVEYGDGYSHTTVLTVSQVDALTLGDNVALADGYLIYTFPAGSISVLATYMSMAVTAASTELQADTPDVGLGSAIATGAVATLTSTQDDYIEGQTATNTNGSATVHVDYPVQALPQIMQAADSHLLHFNVADTWADDTGADLTADIAGTVTIHWVFMG